MVNTVRSMVYSLCCLIYAIPFTASLHCVTCHVNILLFIYHVQETRDVSASFPFLNWRPPLRLIDQLAIYISWYFYVALAANMVLYRSSVADILV